MTLDTDAPVASPFRWRLEHRPDTRFGHAAGGVAGALVVAAMVAFVAAIDNDDPQVAGVLLSIVLVVAAVVAGYWHPRPGPVRRRHGPRAHVPPALGLRGDRRW